jgi:hypothetical protein
METKNLMVLAGEGRYMTRFGSRNRGEVYENLPADIAGELMRDQPGVFQKVERNNKGQWQPVVEKTEEV